MVQPVMKFFLSLQAKKTLWKMMILILTLRGHSSLKSEIWSNGERCSYITHESGCNFNLQAMKSDTSDHSLSQLPNSCIMRNNNSKYELCQNTSTSVNVCIHCWYFDDSECMRVCFDCNSSGYTYEIINNNNYHSMLFRRFWLYKAICSE